MLYITVFLNMLLDNFRLQFSLETPFYLLLLLLGILKLSLDFIYRSRCSIVLPEKVYPDNMGPVTSGLQNLGKLR